MKELEILNAFSSLADPRGSNEKQHEQTLCIAIFTLAVVAGCRGINAMGDWVKGYHDDLVALFEPRKDRLPSYSTLRRVMLGIDYQAYGAIGLVALSILGRTLDIGLPGGQVQLLAVHQAHHHPSQGFEVPQVFVNAPLNQVAPKGTIQVGVTTAKTLLANSKNQVVLG